jgi:hypothetical protein
MTRSLSSIPLVSMLLLPARAGRDTLVLRMRSHNPASSTTPRDGGVEITMAE